MADHDSSRIVISRKEARARGLKRYFTGKSCKNGHIVERFISSYCCIQCAVIRRDEWREANKERENALSLKWYYKNRKHASEKRKEYLHSEKGKSLARKSASEWRANNSEKYKAIVAKNSKTKKARKVRSDRQRARYATDLQYRLGLRLRTRLTRAVKSGQRAGSAVRDLGCTIEYFKEHLERQFKRGMTWENMGDKWHIDHIRPLSSFDLIDRVQLLEACNYKNLQPLWAKDNLVKKNRDPIDFARSLGLLL